MTSESTENIEKKRELKWPRVIKQYRGPLIWTLLVVALYMSFSGHIVPKNTYIRCDDVSILHEPQTDTVSISLLLGISLFLPFTMMCVFEWMHQCNQSNSANEGSTFKIGLRKAYNHFLSLLVGSLFAFFIVEVLKTTASEARPHFLKSCSPKSCNSNVTNDRDRTWIHVTADDCLNPYNLPPRLLIDVMKSFPSGHACIGIFSAVFMTIYMQLRVKVRWSLLFIFWLQTIWWAWALVCCVSRISDRRHHWWDVLAGAAIGGIAAYATVAYLCNWFNSDVHLNRRSKDGRIRLEVTSDGDSPTQLLSNGNGPFGRQTAQLDESSKIHIVNAPH